MNLDAFDRAGFQHIFVGLLSETLFSSISK